MDNGFLKQVWESKEYQKLIKESSLVEDPETHIQIGKNIFLLSLKSAEQI